jgi:CRISPR-associated protein Csd2
MAVAENSPSPTYDGIGELSDVCIKRKIRDRLLETGTPIFVQSDDRKIDSHGSLRSRADAVIPSGKSPEEIAKIACETWFDVRAFGQLFAFKDNKKKKAKSDSAEDTDSGKAEKGVSIGIRGPVSIHPAFSVAPVNVTSTQITKSVSGEGDGTKRGSDTMGMKHRVDQGIYAFYGSMNPQLAKKTVFTDADAEKIKAVLPRLFENDSSSARPEGSMRVLKVIWWKHNSASGQYSSAIVHGSVKVNNDASNPCTLTDLAGLKPEVIEGF